MRERILERALYLVKTAAERGTESNGGNEQLSEPHKLLRIAFDRHGLWSTHAAYLLPTARIVANRNCKLQVRGGRAIRGNYHYINAIDFRSAVAASELNLHGRWRSLHLDRRCVGVIEYGLAINLGEHPRRTRRCNPSGPVRVLDPVGDQLCCQVVVIAARVKRRTTKGKIAVAQALNDKLGTEVLAGIARI